KTITVSIYGDSVYEPDETFYVTLSGATGASIARAQAVGTIVNDDLGVFVPVPTWINESSTYTGCGSFTDPSGGTSWTATIDYGDGSGTQPLALNPDHSYYLNHFYANSGNYAPTITVTNNLGKTAYNAARVIANNVAPTVNAGPDQTTNEGSTVTLNGSANDPGINDVLSYRWTYMGAAGPVTLGTVPTLTITIPDNGSYTLTLPVTAGAGAASSATAVITANNVAPAVSAGGNQTVKEGSLVTLNGTFSDPGTLDTFTYKWHVVSSNGQAISDGTGTSFSFTPVDNGAYTVTYTVTDKDGGVGTDTALITVNNVAPTVNVGANASIMPGNAVSRSGSFADP